MKAIQTNSAPAAIGPYSQAMISGNLIFTSGQISLSPDSGDLLGSTIEEQTEQVCKNLTKLLEAAGSSISNVVKTTCFLEDMKYFAAFNEVYGKHFSHKPARSTVSVKGLPRNALVEIEVIAEV